MVFLVFFCNFLFSCAGYYRYSSGYLPEFPTLPVFQGAVIHPQAWPQDFDYNGKRLVIIGSGATAVTLLPAIAKTAAHVTMLQRSPTYMVSLPEQDPAANWLRAYHDGLHKAGIRPHRAVEADDVITEAPLKS